MDNYIYIILGIIILLIVINVVLTYQNRPPNVVGLTIHEANMEIVESGKNYILGSKIGFIEPERGKFQLLGKIAEQYTILDESQDSNAPIKIDYKLYQIDSNKYASPKIKSQLKEDKAKQEEIAKQKQIEMEQERVKQETAKRKQKEMEQKEIEQKQREMEQKQIEQKQREMEQKQIEQKQKEMEQKDMQHSDDTSLHSRFNRNNKELSLLMSIPIKSKSTSNLIPSFKKKGNLDIAVPDVENSVDQHSRNKSFFW